MERRLLLRRLAQTRKHTLTHLCGINERRLPSATSNASLKLTQLATTPHVIKVPIAVPPPGTTFDEVGPARAPRPGLGRRPRALRCRRE